jgi:hypothetical protein
LSGISFRVLFGFLKLANTFVNFINLALEAGLHTLKNLTLLPVGRWIRVLKTLCLYLVLLVAPLVLSKSLLKLLQLGLLSGKRFNLKWLPQ